MDTHAGRIIVGYDGSESGGAAVDWAAEQAQRHNRSLTVISVVDYAGMLPGVYGPSSWPTLFQEEARLIAAKGAQRAGKCADSIDIVTEAGVGQVSDILIRTSRGADRLVVGNRGHGGLTGTLLGSVGFAVSAHAHCPVVVVRGDSTPPGPDRPVMVGVDDSAGAHAAVTYAAARADEAHAALIVATTYRPVSSQAWTESGYYDVPTEQSRTFDAAARETAGDLTAAAVRQAKEQHPTLNAQPLVITGSPANELVRAADTCGLLVVGTRGQGGFAGLLLGSVSHGVIRSAPCPVVIVPTDERTPEAIGSEESDNSDDA